MGSVIGSAMKENMKEQIEVQASMQRNMMERQIKLQLMLRDRQVAMQLARGREMFNWYATFALVVSGACIGGFRKTKNPAVFAPLLPISFVTAYQWDMCYNGKMNRIRAGAEKIMADEQDLIGIPAGPPSVRKIDEELRKTI
ncbi:plasminogen receptor (KT)-like [Sycon ciliatum]|uniref:plasminogen receptor (KT)-like n=1 Tax=Sycon ciliatum TaxID=27933 RepID=UPI0020A8A0E2|eukprot:scpid85735/ scgid31866/ Plasminogen receptor (KT)